MTDNEVLDKLICTRRSVRAFTGEVPGRELIEQIIEAGRQAPYAKLAVAENDDFRHFIVVPKSSPFIAKTKLLLIEAMKSRIAAMEASGDPKVQRVLEVLRPMVKAGLPAFATGAWLVVVAELRGIPNREAQSLGHVMENMWLKATALGLGFQLLSAVGDLANSQTFCEMLGLPCGAYALESCTIGYPAQTLPRDVRSVPLRSVKWID